MGRKDTQSSRKRHIAKTLAWRLTTTLTAVLIAWAISGDSNTGLVIGSIDFFAKMPTYYFHERVWYKSNFGLINRNEK